jgi:phosphate transport system permease protein
MTDQASARAEAAGISRPAEAVLDLRTRTRPVETVIQAVLFSSGFLSIFTTLGIVWVLIQEAWLFFGDPQVSVVEFFTASQWVPEIGLFGVWPLVTATFVTSIVGMLVAIPFGLAAAVYLSEYADERVRAWVKPLLEVLAGVPTVVYGYFALGFITPLLRGVFGSDTVNIYNMAAAGIAMGILILPLIASLSEDALSSVPGSLRAASFGLGATRFETAWRVVLPAAASGLMAAFIIGISRAVGETMIVALAAGAGPNLTLNPFTSAETITGHIARISGGDISYGSIQYTSIFALGLLLFAITLTLNIISRRVVARFREVYE